MMYSYYTLSLLKVPCPWKRYLTQAQLIQFTSVVIYTVFAFAIVYREGEADARHYICYAVQTFEMTSLFYLFSLFYSKAYKKKQIMKNDPVQSDIPEQASIGSDGSDSDCTGESKKEL